MRPLVVVDPTWRSWLAVADDGDFPLQNLPYGAFESADGVHLGVALGRQIIDLHACAEGGFFDGVAMRELLLAPTLNPLLGAGATTWQRIRARLVELLRSGGDPTLRERAERGFVRDMKGAQMVVPMQVGDYVDFYSSLEHATNLGRMFRPDAEALLPNWRWIPIGYHGRSGSIVIDGTPIVRPCGVRKAPDASSPTFGPSARLDIELELGFVTGSGNVPGKPIPIAQASEHIFGCVLVNDWSARDVQAWEYVPLGPFLGKSFATTLSPWIVPLDALEPFRQTGPKQEPQPLPYLCSPEPFAYDLGLSVTLQSKRMRANGLEPVCISRTNFSQMYWSMAQQLAHASSNGATVRAGDLFASGTISGTTPDSLGSLIELSWNGTRPIRLPEGEERSFLADGDEIILRAHAQRPGIPRIGFGVARGEVVPATSSLLVEER